MFDERGTFGRFALTDTALPRRVVILTHTRNHGA